MKFDKLKILAVSSSLVSVFSFAVFAGEIVAKADTTYSCYPYFLTQEKSNWCWAACAWMSGKQAYPSSAATQTSIVMHVMGSDVNQAALPDEVVEGANFVTYQTCSYQWADAAYPSVFFSIQFIEQKIPMIAFTMMDMGVGYQMTHMVVPYKLVHFSDETNERRLYFFDPKGSYRACNINDLYTGTKTVYTNTYIRYFQTFYRN
ncbi:MAG: hypothetical protein V3G42_01615 [Oscillospiraceae bacterium]